MALRKFDKLWSGDTRTLRLAINDSQNGVDLGDYDLDSAVSFVVAIGDPESGKTYFSKTVSKASVIDGPPEGGEIVITITGVDSAKVPAGYRTLQVWMIDTSGAEFTIFEMSYDHRARLSSVAT